MLLGHFTQILSLCFFLYCNIWVIFFSIEFSLLFSYISVSCRDVSCPLPVCHSMPPLSAMFIPCFPSSSCLSLLCFLVPSLLCSLAPFLICLSSCVKLTCQSTSLWFLFYFDSLVFHVRCV